MKNKILYILIFSILLCGCGKSDKSEFTFFSMNTYINFKIYDSINHSQINIIKSKLEHIENIFSDYKKTALVWKLNKYKTIENNSELEVVLNRCSRISDLTNNSFNVYLGKISELYGFKNKPAPDKLPSSKIIMHYLDEIAKNKVVIKKNIKFTNDVNADFGSCIKGYTLDQLKKYFKSINIKNYIIDFGGNIYAGIPLNKKYFTIGIANPDNPEKLIYKFSTEDKFISTSGDYQNFRIINGIKIHHIIDYNTGRPANNNVRSVTVIGNNGFLTDALSTAFFVMGYSKTKENIHKWKNITKVIFILNEDNKLTVKEIDN